MVQLQAQPTRCSAAHPSDLRPWPHREQREEGCGENLQGGTDLPGHGKPPPKPARPFAAPFGNWNGLARRPAGRVDAMHDSGVTAARRLLCMQSRTVQRPANEAALCSDATSAIAAHRAIKAALPGPPPMRRPHAGASS